MLPGTWANFKRAEQQKLFFKSLNFFSMFTVEVFKKRFSTDVFLIVQSHLGPMGINKKKDDIAISF